MPKEIFRIKAGKPPDTVRTVANWQAWRELEDQRTLDAVAFFQETLCDKFAHDVRSY